MESLIASLVSRYERGVVSRRELIQGLALLATASSTVSAAGLQGSTVNHISIYVSDLQKSKAYYQKAFGLPLLQEDKNTARLGLGKSFLVLRPGNPPGKVDHFAIGVDHYNKDAVLQDLKQRGVNYKTVGDGFHVVDPDGYEVQISSNDPA